MATRKRSRNDDQPANGNGHDSGDTKDEVEVHVKPERTAANNKRARPATADDNEAAPPPPPPSSSSSLPAAAVSSSSSRSRTVAAAAAAAVSSPRHDDSKRTSLRSSRSSGMGLEPDNDNDNDDNDDTDRERKHDNGHDNDNDDTTATNSKRTRHRPAIVDDNDGESKLADEPVIGDDTAIPAATNDDPRASLQASMEDATDQENKDDTDNAVEFVKQWKSGGSEFAQHGIIRSIHLIDFMCHLNLVHRFGPNINFITGRNGSGKSAILLAIQICLGSRAHDTSRGSSLSKLVRTDADESKLTVELANEGAGAFKPNVFGKSIYITRIIKKKGGGSYSIHGSKQKGKSLFNNKKALEEILEFFHIQVTNPIVILSQDVAREFLTGKNGPSEKYELFMRATMLDKTQGEYDDAITKLSATEFKLSHGLERASKLKKKVEDAEARWTKAKHIKKDQEQVMKLAAELIWAHAHIEKKAHDIAQGDVAAQEDVMDKLKQFKTKCEEAIAAFTPRRNELDIEFKTKQARCDEIASKLGVYNSKIKAKKVEASRAMNDLQNHEGKVKRSDEKRAKAMQKIEAIQEEAKRDLAKEEEEIQNRLRDLNAKRIALEEKRHGFEADEAKINQDQTNLRSQLQELGRLEEQARKKKDTLLAAIKKWQDSEKNKLRVFGRHAVEIDQQIRRHMEAKHNGTCSPGCKITGHDVSGHRFGRRPLGPLGAHITMRPEFAFWTRAVETCLTTRVMGAYLVENHHDMRILKQILINITRGGPDMPTIVVMHYAPDPYHIPAWAERVPDRPMVAANGNPLPDEHDGSDTRTRLSCFTAITVDNGWVSNAIIDQSGCERQALMHDPNEAHTVVLRSEEVKGVFLPTGDRVVARGERGQKSVAKIANRRDTQRYLGTDFKQEVLRAREQLQSTEQALVQYVTDRNKLSDKNIAEGRQIKHIRDDIMKINRLLTNNKDEVRAVEQSRAPPMDSTVYEEEVKRLDAEIAELKAKMGDAEQVRDRLATEVKQLETDKQSHDDEAKQADDDVRRISGQLQDLAKETARHRLQLQKVEEKQSRASSEHAAKVKVLAEQRKRKETAEKEVEDLEGYVKDPGTKSASEVEKLNNQKTLLEKKISHDEKKLGATVEDLAESFKRADELYRENTKEIRANRESTQEMKDALIVRQRNWQKYQRTISRRAQALFQEFLIKRNHSGILEFDHKKKKIELNITPNGDADASQSTSDTKTLSGGERSFTSISFISALAAAVECPFRIVDEFDVFMDSVTRRHSIDMLTSLGEFERNRQFVFITPQDISGVKSGPHISVVTLQPPARQNDANQPRIDAALGAAAAP